MRILCVDDEDLVRDIIATMLEDLGHQVLEAEGGEEGLETIAAYGGQFDMVITDIRMPGMSGYAFARKARQRWPKLNVLFATAYDDGMVSVPGPMIRKPISLATLQHAVAAAGTV